MHGSKSKIPSKKSRQAALRGWMNSGVKGFREEWKRVIAEYKKEKW
jgi:hypothetical protein